VDLRAVCFVRAIWYVCPNSSFHLVYMKTFFLASSQKRRENGLLQQMTTTVVLAQNVTCAGDAMPDLHAALMRLTARMQGRPHPAGAWAALSDAHAVTREGRTARSIPLPVPVRISHKERAEGALLLLDERREEDSGAWHTGTLTLLIDGREWAPCIVSSVDKGGAAPGVRRVRTAASSLLLQAGTSKMTLLLEDLTPIRIGAAPTPAARAKASSTTADSGNGDMEWLQHLVSEFKATFFSGNSD